MLPHGTRSTRWDESRFASSGDLPWGVGWAPFVIWVLLLAIAGTFSAIHLFLRSRESSHVLAVVADSALVTRDVDGADSLTAEDWPQLFGPRGDSVSRERRLAWTWPSTGPPEHWHVPAGKGYSSPVAASGDVILFHRLDDREVVACLDAETGRTRWEFCDSTQYRCRYPYSEGPYSTPVLDGDYVYTVGAEARLHCLSRVDGRLLWRRALRDDFQVREGMFGFGAGMLVSGDTLFLNVGGESVNAGIVAFDKHSGATKWSATDHVAAYTTPRVAKIHGRTFLFVLTETGLVSLAPETGQELWVLPFHSQVVDRVNAVTPLVVDDLVLIMSGPGPGAICLRVLPDGSYETVWQDRRVLDSSFNNLIHDAGHVYGFTSTRSGESTFRCVELATGRLKWSFPSELGRGQSLAADGHILLIGEHGHLGALELSAESPQTTAMTAAPILAAPAYSSPALHRGLLFVRNEETLRCFSLRRSD